jgi:outer membrane lipoprotein-sorting protein
MTVIYKEGEDKATIIPLRSSPEIRFRFSVDSFLIKTPTGQRIDQTDIGHLLGFLSKNLQRVRQEEAQTQEDDEKVSFFVWALDYVEEKTLEKYRISVNKKIWLPSQIERYRLDGKLIEVTHILNYSVNSRLDDKIFNP